MATAITQNSGGTPQPDNGTAAATAKAMAANGGGNSKGAVPAGKAGGEIVISRSEARALAAFEMEPEARAMKRAAQDSGLTTNQIRMLKARADRARKAGYTLKGASIVLKATNHPEDQDPHGLLPDGEVSDADAKDEQKAGAMKAAPKGEAATAAKAKTKAKKPAAKGGKVKEAGFEDVVTELVSEALGDETL